MTARTPLRLLAFGALALYVLAHWGGLVADPPAWRLAAVAAIATAAGGLVAATAGLPGTAGSAARAVVACGAFAAGAAVAGLEPRLLLPANWDALHAGLDEGMAGLRTVSWPYDGRDEWVRRTILLGAPAGAVAAALLAFWPSGRAAPLAHAAALVLLLALFGTPVAEREYGAELARGVALALLLGAWLWLPRARGREAALAAAAVCGATLLAVPVAAALDRGEPWVDYRDWNWFGAIGGSAFDFDHSYGPIDWPRDGTTLLRARAARPLYWKVEVLDRFDGVRWVRTGEGATTPPAYELPGVPNPDWVETAELSIRELRSDVAVVAGIPLRVEGLRGVDIAVDGTTTLRARQLSEGDRYSVVAYVPNPSRARLRAAPAPSGFALRRYLRVELPPASGGDALERGGRITVAMPLHGEDPPGDQAARERLVRESAYGRTYALARSLTDDAPTTYDAVKAVERHLLDNYRYSERPAERDLPLDAFLFEDRIGYCQHFSGAMALMLRLVGIPARVVGGFAPGSYNPDEREFRVRDLDAHSWVEVFFAGIGWVQFDPTPSGAPAQSRAEQSAAPTSATGTPTPGRGEAVAARRDDEPEEAPRRRRAEQPDEGLPAWAAPLALLGLAALATAGLWGATALRVRRAGGGADASLAELELALRRLGWRLEPRTTLLALERRLERAAGPRSAAYVRALREARYANGGRLDGDLAAHRRGLRAELGRAAGRLGRVRSWVALPPLPPFRRT